MAIYFTDFLPWQPHAERRALTFSVFFCPLDRASLLAAFFLLTASGHHFFPFIMQRPAALHLAGEGQPLQGLKTGFFMAFDPLLR